MIIIWIDYGTYKWATDDIKMLKQATWDASEVEAWLNDTHDKPVEPGSTPEEMHAKRMAWGPWADELTVYALEV